MQKYLAMEHNEYGTFTMSFSYTILSVLPSIYVRVAHAAHIPVNNYYRTYTLTYMFFRYIGTMYHGAQCGCKDTGRCVSVRHEEF